MELFNVLKINNINIDDLEFDVQESKKNIISINNSISNLTSNTYELNNSILTLTNNTDLLNNSISSMSDLLTSLLYDTYTNQTFIYSDINVIRIDTSNNYSSIQKISTEMNSFLPSSKSTIFASESELNSKFNVSDSTYFLPSSDFTSPTVEIEYLTNISKFMSISNQNSILTFNDVIYNMYPTTFENGILGINSQPLLHSLSLSSVSWTGMYNTIDFITAVSCNLNMINVKNINGSFKDNILSLSDCNMNGIFWSNTFITKNYGYNTISGNIGLNKFEVISNLDIHLNNIGDNESNTYSFITNLNITKHNSKKFGKNSFEEVRFLNICNVINFNDNTISRGSIANISGRTFTKNSFRTINKLNIYADSFLENTLYYQTLLNFYSYQSTLPFVDKGSFPWNKTIIFNDVHLLNNTFENVTKIVLNYSTWLSNFTSRTNKFSNVKLVDFNLNETMKTDFEINNLLGLENGNCFIEGVNINMNTCNELYTLLTHKISSHSDSSDIYKYSRLRLLSFNSTNKWVNAGFNSTLSSANSSYGLFNDMYCSPGVSNNVQGNIISETGKMSLITDALFLQPKFSPNFNSIKHYMFVYSNSYRDYFELDPNAVEAEHNNNACENILLMKDYNFYSDLATLLPDNVYTFIKWPSTEIRFPKSCYQNNTLLNTISDITKSLTYDQTMSYTISETTSHKPFYINYTAYSSVLTLLGNTSSSSQLYAGLSFSGAFTTISSSQRAHFR